MAASTEKRNSESCDLILDRLSKCIPARADNTPLHAPTFEGNEWLYVKDCLDTGWVSSVGKYVDLFEQRLSEYTGSKYCIATCNGTAALHMALILVGVKSGDEVIIPDLTFVATANAVAYVGAVPQLADISPVTLGLDPTKLRTWLDEIAELKPGVGTINRKTGRRISAVVAMHTFGHPVELDEILSVCNQFGLPLVEDAAESIGSYYKSKHTGTFGKIGTLSFNGNKTITTGGGGAILTDDAIIAKRAKHLTTTAKKPHQWHFSHDEVAYNYRLPNINAALGCAQLEQLDAFLEKKREVAQRYIKQFHGAGDVRVLAEPPGCRSNYWLNALILSDESGASLERLLQETNGRGIQTRPVWDLMHTLPAFLGVPKMPTPIAEAAAKTVLCVPSSASLGRSL